MKTAGIFQFGEFQVDARTRTLRREEEVVALNRRAFDVLVYFVQNPGKVLTREELLQNVWAESFVDENSLAQSISVLRRALEEKPGDNSYIVTLPGRGYQFVATVRVVGAENVDAENGDRVGGLAVSAGSDSGGLVFQKHTIKTSVTTRNDVTDRISPPVFRGRTTRMIAAFAIAATVVTSVGLGGAWYRRSHWVPKLTEKDTIVVADFENRTSDPVFDDTLKQALTVGLDQSPYLNVVSDQKIGEALKLMGRDSGQRFTGEVARDLCQRVSGNAMLQGSITSLGSQYVVVLSVTNCANGDLLASEQARAENKEKILPALDKAASSLREKLGESLGSIAKYDTPVEQATTPSLPALQAYSAGINAWKSLVDHSNEAAIPFYQRAIELDPNFVMAYAHLGASYSNLGVEDLATENMNKAFNLRNRVSERERLYIDSRYYMVVTGEIEKAIPVLDQWRRVYPREWSPAYTLVVEYRRLGRYEDALREARASVLLEPGVSSNYYILALTAMALNRLDEAQAALKEWQSRNPVSNKQLYIGYTLAFLRNDPAGMQKQSVDPSYHADTEAYYGLFRRAREFTRRDAARLMEVALWEAAAGYSEQARRDVSAPLNLSKSNELQIAALALALAGDTVRAEIIAAELAKRNPLDTLVNMYWLPTIRAAIQLNRNSPVQAVQELEQASRFDLGANLDGSETTPLFPVYLRGQAFLALHQGREAAAEFQKYIDHRCMVREYPLGALARVGLARAYAMQGDTVKARTAYEDFFTLWKDADPDIPILKAAKLEYAKLNAPIS